MCLSTAQPWIHRGTRVRPGRQPSGWRRSKPGTTLWCCWSSSVSCCSTCPLMPSVSCWRPNLLSSWYFSCKSALRKVPKSHLSTTKYKYYYIYKVLRLQLTHILFCHSIQDTTILLNLIIILLMLSSTFVFQVGLVAILLERFRALLMLSALYLTFSVILHSWLVVPAAYTDIFWSIFRWTKFYKLSRCIKNIVSWHCCQNLRLFDTTKFIWTDSLQVMFVLQRTGKVKVRYDILSLFFCE